MRTRRWQAGFTALAVAATLLAAAPAADAAPGDLETGFGSDGRVVMGDAAYQNMTMAGSTVISLGLVISLDPTFTTFQLRATAANGTPDPAWFGGGSRDLTIDGLFATTGAVAVDSAGRVVLATSAMFGSPLHRVWRFEADGDLDPTFGTNGMATVTAPAHSFAEVTGIGFQPDGDIIVTLVDMLGGGVTQRPRLVRVTGNGTWAQTLDLVPTAFEGFTPSSAVVDSVGRTTVLLPQPGKLTVRRYTEAFVLDTSFSGDGTLDITRPGGSGDDATWGGALDVAADGTVLVSGVVGTSAPNPDDGVQEAALLARVLPSGQLDPSFSGDGIELLARPSGQLTPTAVHRTDAGGAVVSARRFKEG